MLIVKRKVGEGVEVGGSLVRVMKLDGRTVSLGIVAPEEVTIHREEVAERIRGGDGSRVVRAAADYRQRQEQMHREFRRRRLSSRPSPSGPDLTEIDETG